jgi:hypothetical protein
MSKRRPYPANIQAEVVAAKREHREVELSGEELAELGHGKRPLTKVIRSFCLSCQGGNLAEVRRCTSVGCALFPYGMGKNPFSARKGRTGFAEPSARRRFQDGRGENAAETG